MSNKIRMLEYKFRNQNLGRLTFFSGKTGCTFGISSDPNFMRDRWYYFDYKKKASGLKGALELLEIYDFIKNN